MTDEARIARHDVKPSYELSERLVEELHRRGIPALGWNDAVYGALKVALAAVPEPSADAAEYRRLWGLCTESRLRACERAEAAEAKLEKVREWLGKNAGEVNAGARTELYAILDEAP